MALRIRAGRTHLLNLPQCINKLLDEPEVRAQPPEQKEHQQGDQGDNYQVLQITFRRLWRVYDNHGCEQIRAERGLGIVASASAFFTGVGQIVLTTPGQRIDVTAARR